MAFSPRIAFKLAAEMIKTDASNFYFLLNGEVEKIKLKGDFDNEW